MASAFPTKGIVCFRQDGTINWISCGASNATLFANWAGESDFTACKYGDINGLRYTDPKLRRVVFNSDWVTRPHYTLFINTDDIVTYCDVDADHKVEALKKAREPATNPPQPFMQVPGEGAKTLASLPQLGQMQARQEPTPYDNIHLSMAEKCALVSSLAPSASEQARLVSTYGATLGTQAPTPQPQEPRKLRIRRPEDMKRTITVPPPENDSPQLEAFRPRTPSRLQRLMGNVKDLIIQPKESKDVKPTGAE